MRPRPSLAIVLSFLFFLAEAPAQPKVQGGPAKAGDPKRGEFLVTMGGCNDCHTPKIMTPTGPVLNPAKILSGHQADAKIPPVPKDLFGPDKWAGLTTNDFTAWAGPWGMSFAANLTPDPATGIGGWTESIFMNALRNGKHLGDGRPILPPMPWQNFAGLADQDLRDIFAYLKTLKPVANKVPEPHPPH